MSVSNLFKSKKQRERDERKERRQSFRQAENTVEDVKDRVKQMDKDGKKLWEQAREAMKSGQKSVANRLLISYRAQQVLMGKLEQKRWVFEQYLTKLQAASSDQQFADALAGINKVTNIDPERVADVFEEAQDLLGEQVDSDRFWERMYTKETEGASAAMEDHIPSMDELTKQLSEEAAVEVGGGTSERVGSEVDSRIQAGQDRVKKLLDGK